MYRRATIPVPVSTGDALVDQLMSQVAPQTRVIFVSHITSPTALTIPVAEICRRARERGIITVVDGAHVPGQIDLDIRSIGPDYYTANLHKWLCAPKGAALLYVRRELQSTLDPLVVSWGWDTLRPSGSEFIDWHEYRGTRDISAALAVPAAIDFQRNHAWSDVRARCHRLLNEARPRISAALGALPIAPDSETWYRQMSAFLLPEDLDGEALQRRLFEEVGIEVPVFDWNGRQTIRVSVQGYNDAADLDRLVEALQRFVPELRDASRNAATK